MMKIRMIGDRLVAADGQHAQTWPDGSVHEVLPSLGEPLVRDGWAARADAGPTETKVVAPAETKADEPAPDVEEPVTGVQAPEDVQVAPAAGGKRKKG